MHQLIKFILCSSMLIQIIYLSFQMFCGFCANDKEEDTEIVIRAPNSSQLEQRVSRNNSTQIMSLVQQSQQYSMIMPSKYQQYLEQSKQSGTKFTDPEFPPNNNSVGVEIQRRQIVWKRVTQVVKNAVMVENFIQPADVQQGNIGDCYFLASISSIAEVPQRIKKIFCHQMQLKPEGIYRLQVACQGQLHQIVIDDFIPVFEGSNRPVFCKPHKNEVWVMLLEKAWAKLSGSYGNTSAGYPHEVLNTFLEAPCFYYEIPFSALKFEHQKQTIWKYLSEGDKYNFAMCAGSRAAHVCGGIKPGHTYSLLACYQLKVGNELVRLVKLRNPWGDTEFKGKYSEYDEPFWSRVDPITKLAIFKKRNEDDGIFTIQITEFIRNFQCLDISHDRNGFNYVFERVKANNSQPFFYELEVTNDSQGQFYFTIEKGFDRNAYIRERRVDYGYSKLLVSKKQEQVGPNGQPVTNFRYVDSKLQTNFPDLTIRCKSLSPGNYIIFGETSFPGKNQNSVTLSVYSQAMMNVRKIKMPEKHFLHKVFIDHGNRFNNNRVEILGSSTDWTASKFLFQEGGFGYIMAELGNLSHNRIKIQCNVQKVYESGFYVLERGIQRPQGYIEIQIGPGEQGIIVFGINFTKTSREIDFPPKGIKITRVI